MPEGLCPSIYGGELQTALPGKYSFHNLKMWKPEQKYYQYCQWAGHRSQEIVAYAQDNHPCDTGLKGGCPDAEPCTHGDAQDGHFFTAVVIKYRSRGFLPCVLPPLSGLQDGYNRVSANEHLATKSFIYHICFFIL